MTGRYILDTNIVIALFDGDMAVRERIGTADEVFIPSTVLGELYSGAFQSSRPNDNVARIDDLARSYAILAIDETTARIYGTLQRDLRAIGKPIPMNDVWIAAAAQQWGVIVATRNDHFAVLTSIAMEAW